jgi:hypothetical protein
MARSGSFFRGAEPFGQALSIVHPPDNNIQAARWDPEIAALGVTDAQKDELQRRADEVYASEVLERDYYGIVVPH